MASNVTAQSLLEKISEDHLECSICTNRFRQPKVLDCLHSFCLICLQELRQCQGPSNTKLMCPLCRRETILEGSGVADLPNNFALSAPVEEVTMQEKVMKVQGSGIKCQACNGENQAISRCMDCDHFLCQECQMAHGRLTLMKSHKIYTLAQFQSGEIVYKSKLREEVPKCGKHPDQNLNVYCNTCEQVICLMCTVLDHVNPKHTHIGLSEGLEKCKKKVAELVAKVEKSKTELSTTMHETDMSRKKLDSMFKDTKRKITKKADEEVAKIREEEQKLLKQAERIYKDRVTTFETVHATNSQEVTQAEHKLDEVKQLMAQASCYEILELQQKLLHNLSELTGKQAEKVPDKLAFLDFEDGERSLGRLVLEEAPKTVATQSPWPWGPSLKKDWQLKTVENDFKQRGRISQIAAFSDFEEGDKSLGKPILEEETKTSAKLLLRSVSCFKERWKLKTDIMIALEIMESLSQIVALSKSMIHVLVWGVNENKLLTFSLPNSKYMYEPPPIPQRVHIKGLTDVRHISLSKDDKLIVVDGGTVKVFNKQHQLLHQFTPCRGLESQPTCLAVDEDNLIAIGYEHKEEIFLHNQDGSLIRRLPAPMIGYELAIYKQQFIYTNYMNQLLLSIDYNGARVFSVDISNNMQEGGNPRGVCCDSDGSIYVAVSRYPTGDILHYSPDGKYIGHAISGCGVAYGITLTSDGDLAVATRDSVKIYHRV